MDSYIEKLIQSKYMKFEERITKPPTSNHALIEMYHSLEKITGVIHLLFHIKSWEKKKHVQSFQHKILKKFINYNYNLYKGAIDESPLCIYILYKCG